MFDLYRVANQLLPMFDNCSVTLFKICKFLKLNRALILEFRICNFLWYNRAHCACGSTTVCIAVLSSAQVEAHVTDGVLRLLGEMQVQVTDRRQPDGTTPAP